MTTIGLAQFSLLIIPYYRFIELNHGSQVLVQQLRIARLELTLLIIICVLIILLLFLLSHLQQLIKEHICQHGSLLLVQHFVDTYGLISCNFQNRALVRHYTSCILAKALLLKLQIIEAIQHKNLVRARHGLVVEATVAIFAHSGLRFEQLLVPLTPLILNFTTPRRPLLILALFLQLKALHSLLDQSPQSLII